MVGTQKTVQSIEERVAQIQSYAQHFAQALQAVDERRHLLEPVVGEGEIQTALVNRFKNTYGSRGYEDMIRLLAEDLIRGLVRVFLDGGKKTASMCNIHRKASAKDMFAAMRDAFAAIPEKWRAGGRFASEVDTPGALAAREIWIKKEVSEFQDSFDEGWEVATNAIAAMNDDEVSAKLLSFRNKYYAHYEMAPLGEDPRPFDVGALEITYSDLFAFLDRYSEAGFEMSRVLTGNVHDLEGFSKAHSLYGRDMWRILAGMEPIAHTNG